MILSTENLFQHTVRSFHETFGQGGWIAPNLLRGVSSLAAHQLITHQTPVWNALTSLAGRAKDLPGAARGLKFIADANAALLPFAGTSVGAIGASLASGFLVTQAINSILGPNKGQSEKELAKLRNFLTKTERLRYGRTYPSLSIEQRMKQLDTSLAEEIQAKEAKIKQLQAMHPTPAPVPSAAALHDISGTTPAPHGGGGAPAGLMTKQQLVAFINHAKTLQSPQAQQAALNALPPAQRAQVLEAAELDAMLHPPQGAGAAGAH